MEIQDFDMKNIVRIGTVSAVDGKKARVMFDDGMTSGFLYCIQHERAIVNVAPDNKHAHEGATPEQPEHYHPGSVLSTWAPSIGETVVVLYIPIFNADGFILGGL